MRLRLLAVPLVALSLTVLAGCASAAPAPSASASASVVPAAEGCQYVPGAGAAREVDAPSVEPAVSGTISATLQTSAGDIPMTLDADRTPCTVGSFVSLADQGYYSDTVCHRLTTSGIFVLQCGDPSGTGRGGPGYSYADELDGTETYPAGTVAMANAGPDTNGSQFFLVYEDSQLPPSYTVFGQLDAAGLAVVQQIAAAGTDTGATDGAPATPVTITGIAVG
jgi:peptidyl-prolyl cis-trans isomerase B (cyclophilin B)